MAVFDFSKANEIYLIEQSFVHYFTFFFMHKVSC